MFSTKTFVITFLSSALLVCVSASINFSRAEVQQRQIDQLCQVVFTLAREQGATNQSGFVGDKEYCFFFADYNRNIALLGEFDQKISYDKKPRLIIMHNVDERNLEYWAKQPVIYDRYKKIPN